MLGDMGNDALRHYLYTWDKKADFAIAVNARQSRRLGQDLSKVQHTRPYYIGFFEVDIGRGRGRDTGRQVRRPAVLESVQQPSLAKADGLCHLRKAVSRVKDRQCNSSDRTHDAVEGDEFGLVLHEWIAPSSHHLCDSVDASREDGQEGDDHCAGEELEAHCL